MDRTTRLILFACQDSGQHLPWLSTSQTIWAPVLPVPSLILHKDASVNTTTFQFFTSGLKVGDKIIEFTSFNLFTVFIALDRSLMFPCLSLVLRSINSKAMSGLDPCTVRENGHFVFGSGKDNLLGILKQTRSHSFHNKMFWKAVNFSDVSSSVYNETWEGSFVYLQCCFF